MLRRNRKNRKRDRRQSVPGPIRRFFQTGSQWVRAKVAWRGALVLVVLVVLLAAQTGLARLERHVDQLILDRFEPRLRFLNFPPQLTSQAFEGLWAVAAEQFDRPWTHRNLVRDIAEALAGSPWISRVEKVWRKANGEFEVRCVFRVPLMVIVYQGRGYPVDAEGVRLPSLREQNPAHLLIEGVGGAPPALGSVWTGEDVQAALTLVQSLHDEPFVEQLRSVRVANFSGRSDPYEPHILLTTDQPGGAIHWGSAPGQEVEENSVSQKTALLRETYHRTGRVDGGYRVIDISTFADRFSVIN